MSARSPLLEDDSRLLPITHRVPHYPSPRTRDDVRNMVAFGLQPEQIASVLHCLPTEVTEHYADELEHGLARVNAQVQAAVLHSALYRDDVSAMKLWLINKAGWRAGDGPRALLNMNIGTGADGQPGGELTVVQRREVITRLLKAADQAKRASDRDAQVIEGEIVPRKKPTNGSGTGGSHNGGDTNGAGRAGASGTKHR